jgi:hypothetical protein
VREKIGFAKTLDYLPFEPSPSEGEGHAENDKV